MATEKGVERRLKRRREQIADRFKDALKRRNLNQVEFAKLADMRVSFVNRVLQAKANLTLQTVCDLEETLGYDLIAIPQIFEDTEQPSLSGSGSITGKKVRK